MREFENNKIKIRKLTSIYQTSSMFAFIIRSLEKLGAPFGSRSWLIRKTVHHGSIRNVINPSRASRRSYKPYTSTQASLLRSRYEPLVMSVCASLVRVKCGVGLGESDVDAGTAIGGHCSVYIRYIQAV